MLHRSLCALTVVTFASCAGGRDGMPDGRDGGAADPSSQPGPVLKDSESRPDAGPDTVPAEQSGPDDEVGPGMIIFDSDPPPAEPDGTDQDHPRS